MPQPKNKKAEAPVKIDRIKWIEKTVRLKQLKPFEKNPRKISAERYEKLKARIAKDGYRTRISATIDLRVIGGHQRIKILGELGIDPVQILVPDRKITDAQYREMLISDNVNYGEYDGALMLAADFAPDELKAADMLENYAVSILGTEPETAEAGLTDPDHIPGQEKVCVSRVGDIWICEKHRLMCGDSTVAGNVSRLLAGEKPNLMVTDPPYGVEYDAEWRDKSLGAGKGGRAKGKVTNDAKSDWREAWELFPGSVAYVWQSDKFLPVVAESLTATGFALRCLIVWAKKRFAIGRGDYHFQHETAWYAVRKTGNWKGGRSQSTLWEIEHSKSDTGHSTQKPVECMRRPMANNSGKGDYVYEPFMGSGTSLIAAHQMGRVSLGMEILPIYVDVAVRRWQEFTGKEARLEGSGETFNERLAALEAADKKTKRKKAKPKKDTA